MNIDPSNIFRGRPRRAILHQAPGILFLLLTASSSPALQLRVASYNTLFGVGTPGTSEYSAMRDTLQRIDADLVGLQELTQADFANFVQLANELGYPHTAWGGHGPLAGSLYLGYYSRYPISEVSEVQEPVGATEFTRWPLRVVVDVPGALNPLVVYDVHSKASSGTANDFRRGVELRRTISNVNARVASNPLDTEYVVLGDFNDSVFDAQPTSFTSIPGGLPASYSLGSDLTFPILYRVYPVERMAEVNLTQLELFQEDTASQGTFETGGRLDYIYVSDEIWNNPFSAPVGEVYNSVHDDGVGGLAKAGTPLPVGTSALASDHYPLFADIQLIDLLPCVNPVVLISEVADHPTNPNANYVELYNSGTSSLDLSGDSLVLYLNGATPLTTPLTGVIGPGQTYVLAADAGAYLATYGVAARQTAADLAQMDGNEVVALKNANHRLFDFFGVPGEPTGSGDFSMSWAYPNGSARRVLGVSDPFSEWVPGEWLLTNGFAALSPGSHTACDVADVYFVGPELAPDRPAVSNQVQVQISIIKNLPASNISATANYRINGGTYIPVSMTLSSNTTWCTPPFDATATHNNLMEYYVDIQFDGPAALPLNTPTNLYAFPPPPGGGGTNGTSTVLFNEFRANDAGTDDAEFVELVAPAGTDLTGYTLAHHNGNTGVGPLWVFTFPGFVVPEDGVVSSNGAMLGFVVIGDNSGLVANTDFTLPGRLQNGADGLILYDAAGGISDAAAWEGAGDLIADDPGTVTLLGSTIASNYLHVTVDDTADDRSLQAPNSIWSDSGVGWSAQNATPGAINIGQSSGNLQVPGTDVGFQDSDGDGVANLFDNCPDLVNPLQTDMDGDGLGDACDPDLDNDGVANGSDNCPSNANTDQADLDNDGTGDACDTDVDGDGVFNEDDNCPVQNNPGQADLDGDGMGDACDSDRDGDGMPNDWETANGLDPDLDDAAGNPDEDGFDNFAEYLADTDPNDIGSFIRITGIEFLDAPVRLRLSFVSSTNRSYRLSWFDLGITNPTWIVLQSNLAGQASTSSFDDGVTIQAGRTNVSYRIEAEAP